MPNKKIIYTTEQIEKILRDVKFGGTYAQVAVENNVSPASVSKIVTESRTVKKKEVKLPEMKSSGKFIPPENATAKEIMQAYDRWREQKNRTPNKIRMR